MEKWLFICQDYILESCEAETKDEAHEIFKKKLHYDNYAYGEVHRYIDMIHCQDCGEVILEPYIKKSESFNQCFDCYDKEYDAYINGSYDDYWEEE
jgi:formylmethanofuran dehydrogenase subunit E